MHDNDKVESAWKYLSQVASDYVRTLPPSAAEAVTRALNECFQTIEPVLIEALTPKNCETKE